jgi:DNA-binding CsgD family transcriptional regulator
MDVIADLEQGRRYYREQAWLGAFECLTACDQVAALDAEDLELLARAAYMIGRDDEYVASLERACQILLDAGNAPRAVRCGFWIGHSFLFRGEKARATGWFARAERLLDDNEHDCVERGYLRIPLWLEQMARGDFESGYATTAEAAEIGKRFGDADLVWLARDDQARALLRLGRVEEGLRLVDEALIAATAGDLSPIVTGIVYCNTIAFCRARYEVRRVREWTSALTHWCARQPEMVAHNGLCLVHRAEIMMMQGAWEKALEEARRSADRFTLGALNQLAGGAAFYCQGEAHRMRGDYDAAEQAYRLASQRGREPQPGLALMRLAQGKSDSAVAAIRRVVGESTVPLARAGLLPAYVEIMLAIGSLDLARAACRELDEISQRFGGEVLQAMSAHSMGTLALADGRPSDALTELRRALGIWAELGALYEVARIRVRVGLACRALEDEDAAALELLAARNTFAALGAAPDCAWVDSLAREASPDQAHGLTARELQVLRRVAGGKTNRDIALELFISEHTVARHVQNIFLKLDVSSRSAATAFAFSHDLVSRTAW